MSNTDFDEKLKQKYLEASKDVNNLYSHKKPRAVKIIKPDRSKIKEFYDKRTALLLAKDNYTAKARNRIVKYLVAHKINYADLQLSLDNKGNLNLITVDLPPGTPLSQIVGLSVLIKGNYELNECKVFGVIRYEDDSIVYLEFSKGSKK